MNSSYTRIKICGMTRVEDIRHAINLGVDAIGLIFYPASPRCVSLEQAKDLLAHLPPFVDVVAVVVNPDTQHLKELLTQLPINLIQFHGEESADFCEQFDFPFIKAVAVQEVSQIPKAAMEFSRARALLLDTPSLTQKGGTGRVFDWNMIPSNISLPYILAGGLNKDNIQQAIEKTSPYAVDINSGIESKPGIKDHSKMNQLIKVIRGMNK